MIAFAKTDGVNNEQEAEIYDGEKTEVVKVAQISGEDDDMGWGLESSN